MADLVAALLGKRAEAPFQSALLVGHAPALRPHASPSTSDPRASESPRRRCRLCSRPDRWIAQNAHSRREWRLGTISGDARGRRLPLAGWTGDDEDGRKQDRRARLAPGRPPTRATGDRQKVPRTAATAPQRATGPISTTRRAMRRVKKPRMNAANSRQRAGRRSAPTTD
uniref:Uncharacterized protein n=1 Tax=Plectus sambesii TaxID=2011161 RepID=A0A914V1I3_9BILA